MNSKIFNEEQMNFIKDNYMSMTNRQLAAALGEKYNSDQIMRFLGHNKMNRGRKPPRFFTNEEKQYIKDHYLYQTYEEVGEAIHATKSEVTSYVNKHLGHKNIKFNDRYFQYIDTPTKAYWLGFIYADGYVIQNQNGCSEFGIKLQARDHKVLEDINNELGGQHSIKYSHFEGYVNSYKSKTISDMANLRVYSKNLVSDLISHNIKQNKSTLPYYPIVEDKYFFDFLRGYIDGDGYMSDGIVTGNKSYSTLVLGIVSSHREVFDYINEQIKVRYNIEGGISYHKGSYEIRWCTKNAMKLLDMIYYSDNVQFLQRKYDKYKAIKAAISEHEMKKSGNIGEGLTANTEIREEIA